MAKRKKSSGQVERKKGSSESERAGFIKDVRGILEAKRHQIAGSISSSMDDMRQSDHRDLTASDVDDIGSSGDTDTAYRLLELESVELTEIDHALERINAGTYGICEECSQPINIERLQALPFTSMCINCKRLQESSYQDDY